VDDVIRAEIITIRGVWMRVALFANAALGGNQHALAHTRDLFERLTEHLLANAVAINIREVEQGVAGFEGGDHGLASNGFAFRRDFGRFPSARDSPAAVGQPARGQGTAAQLNGLHRRIVSREVKTESNGRKANSLSRAKEAPQARYICGPQANDKTKLRRSGLV